MSRPRWITDTLRLTQCRCCGNRLDYAIIEGVGVVRPPQHAKHIAGPAVAVLVSCAQCGRKATVINEMPRRKEMLDYMDRIIIWSWQEFACGRRKPERNGAQEKPSQPPIPGGSESFGSDDADDDANRLCPSIRPGTPSTPIGVDEQRRFLRRLHRTSMNPNTKSFRNWLSRLMR